MGLSPRDQIYSQLNVCRICRSYLITKILLINVVDSCGHGFNAGTFASSSWHWTSHKSGIFPSLSNASGIVRERFLQCMRPWWVLFLYLRRNSSRIYPAHYIDSPVHITDKRLRSAISWWPIIDDHYHRLEGAEFRLSFAYVRRVEKLQCCTLDVFRF